MKSERWNIPWFTPNPPAFPLLACTGVWGKAAWWSSDCSVSLTQRQGIKGWRKDAFLREIKVPPQSEPISSHFSSDDQRPSSQHLLLHLPLSTQCSAANAFILFGCCCFNFLYSLHLLPCVAAGWQLRISFPCSTGNLKQNYVAQRNLGTVTWFYVVWANRQQKNQVRFFSNLCSVLLLACWEVRDSLSGKKKRRQG